MIGRGCGMMPDLEKVIKGLECCSQMAGEVCRECPYANECEEGEGLLAGSAHLAADALSLLKAQEPRVMPADEIVLSAEPSKWLWVERKGDYCAEAYKAGKTVSGLIAFECETPCAFLYCEYPGEYGKSWRCWTSRPTEEQREAVKWND